MFKTTGENWQPPQHVDLIPDIGDITLIPNRDIKTSLREKLETGGDKMLWLTDETPAEGFESFESTSFEHVPEWAEGRKASLQGVFFGRVTLGDEIETPVAVKPYLAAFNSGVHDAAMHLYLESRGLRVYRLLGMAWSKAQGYVMITSFEEESRSLDNVDWSKKWTSPIGEHLTNLEAIEQVGQSLGLMHASGVIHKDTQVQNFAVNGREVVLTDLTSARTMVDDKGNIDEVGLATEMQADLQMLVKSILGKGFLHGASSEERAGFFLNVVAPAYRSGLYRAENIAGSASSKFRATVETAILDTFAYLEEDKKAS